MELPPPIPPTLTSPRKKWKIENEIYRIDVSQAKPIPWEKTYSLQWTQQLFSYHIISGFESTGVIVAELEYEHHKKGCIIIKGMDNICSEVFATLFAQFMGIQSPQVRVVEFCPFTNDFSQNEWDEIRLALISNPKLINEHRIHKSDQMKAEKMLNMAFFLLYEFIPSQIHLSHILEEWIMDCNANTNQIWFDLGRIIIFDMLVNNFDRLPCDGVWNNQGNLNNVLVIEMDQVKHAIAIDQAVYCIDNTHFKENYQKYMHKVQLFLQRIQQKEETLLNYFVEYLVPEYQSNQMISDFIKEQFVMGVETTVTWLKNHEHTIKDDLKMLKRQVEQMKTGEDWADVYAKSLEHIQLDFITEMVQLVIDTWTI